MSNVSSLHQNVSYDSYKSVMLQNGLDIEALKQSNDSAINALQATIVSLSEQTCNTEASRSGYNTASIPSSATR